MAIFDSLESAVESLKKHGYVQRYVDGAVFPDSNRQIWIKDNDEVVWLSSQWKGREKLETVKAEYMGSLSDFNEADLQYIKHTFEEVKNENSNG